MLDFFNIKSNGKEKSYMAMPLDIKSEDIKEDGIFTGMGSLFDKKPDSHRHLIAPGAFTKTLAKGGRNKTGIAMLYQHWSDKVPGVWLSLAEDKRGLKAEGQLAIKTQLGNDIYEVMKLSAKTKTFKYGLSIGYKTISYEADEKKKVMTLTEIELWELSIVTFPAKLGAFITTVKNIEDAKTPRQLENALRESGLTKQAAQYVVKLCKGSLRESKSKPDTALLDGILGGLRETNQSIVDHQKQYNRNNALQILDALKTINNN